MAALLLRTPDPRSGESILGYILRVSERNGYDSPWHVFRHAGYEQRGMFTAGINAQRLAAILGKDPTQLQKHAYLGVAMDGQPEYRLNGKPIGRGLHSVALRLTRPEICPSCIKEQGFASVFWDASVCVACPLHRSMLLQRCPACKCGLKWFRPGLLKCGCGASLADAVTEPASSATIELMHVLRCKILDDPPPAVGALHCGLPLVHLSAMSLDSMLRVIATLERLNRPSVPKGGAAAAAVEVFADWPTGFHTYLRRMSSEGVASGVQAVGLSKRFSKLYGSLFRSHAGISGVEFVREAFVAFGLKECGLATVDSKLCRGEPQEGRYVSANRFAEVAGLRPITIRKWVEEGALCGNVVEFATQKRYVIDSESAKGALRPGGAAMEMRDAARKIGVPVSVLRELKRSKQFSQIEAINCRQGFWDTDLDALSARILATADQLPLGWTPSAKECRRAISLGEVLYGKKFRSDRAKGAFVGELLAGRMVPLGRLGEGLTSIQILQVDVDEFRRRFEIGDLKHTVAIDAAAAILGCKKHAVYALLRAGHLQRLGGSLTGIRRDSVERFQSHWTPINVLAKRLGTTLNWVAGRVDVLGVTKLRVPVRRGCAATFVAVNCIQQVMDDGAEENAKRMDQAGRLSSAEVRDLAAASLRTYLSELRKSGESLPMRGGKPNRAEIARACGFSRDLFYASPELLSHLDGELRRMSNSALENPRLSTERSAAARTY